MPDQTSKDVDHKVCQAKLEERDVLIESLEASVLEGAQKFTNKCLEVESLKVKCKKEQNNREDYVKEYESDRSKLLSEIKRLKVWIDQQAEQISNQRRTYEEANDERNKLREKSGDQAKRLAWLEETAQRKGLVISSAADMSDLSGPVKLLGDQVTQLQNDVTQCTQELLREQEQGDSLRKENLQLQEDANIFLHELRETEERLAHRARGLEESAQYIAALEQAKESLRQSLQAQEQRHNALLRTHGIDTPVQSNGSRKHKPRRRRKNQPGEAATDDDRVTEASTEDQVSTGLLPSIAETEGHHAKLLTEIYEPSNTGRNLKAELGSQHNSETTSNKSDEPAEEDITIMPNTDVQAWAAGQMHQKSVTDGGMQTVLSYQSQMTQTEAESALTRMDAAVQTAHKQSVYKSHSVQTIPIACKDCQQRERISSSHHSTQTTIDTPLKRIDQAMQTQAFECEKCIHQAQKSSADHAMQTAVDPAKFIDHGEQTQLIDISVASANYIAKSVTENDTIMVSCRTTLLLLSFLVAFGVFSWSIYHQMAAMHERRIWLDANDVTRQATIYVRHANSHNLRIGWLWEDKFLQSVQLPGSSWPEW